MEEILEKQVSINAASGEVWKLLTDTALMKTWMGSAETRLEIATSWEVGTPIVIKGFHHVNFENRGSVLEYVPNSVVSYNFVSSISRLPDEPGSYTTLRFVLTPQEDHTVVSLSISNFPTEAIYHHLNFYWNVTLAMLGRQYA
ncbi:SRPBCC domain-containing protein [Chitinophaga filiformis]|uniref:SRPBCC family protein n=1 Tax=Chitinophaga filiformis TaxID=104663 RepID=UPI001F30B9B1|nr:SRPBCC domain-containing protein [Chitinophaga filiformis]MCF6404661.1 SRPBCC domain-containing protein [Chitinophaga filiformis]